MLSLGFSDFRVRVSNNKATILLKKKDFPLYYELEQKINNTLLKFLDKVELSDEAR